MTSVLQEIIELLTSGITGVAQGIGSGVSDLVQNIFLTSGENGAQSLSVFGGVIIVFAGISLALGLSKWCMSFIQSLGN